VVEQGRPAYTIGSYPQQHGQPCLLWRHATCMCFTYSEPGSTSSVTPTPVHVAAQDRQPTRKVTWTATCNGVAHRSLQTSWLSTRYGASTDPRARQGCCSILSESIATTAAASKAPLLSEVEAHQALLPPTPTTVAHS
jgi:hypothetical protein